MKLGRKDYTISVKTGTDANKAKFKKECVQGEIYHATDTGFFYIAEVTAGASDATLAQFGTAALPALQNGFSVSFDGTNDYMSIGNVTEVNSASNLSISFWFNLNVIPSVNSAPIIIGSSDFWNQISDAGFRYWNGTATNTSYSFSTGVWYHTVMVQTGTTLKVYVNGGLEGTHTVNAISSTAGNNLTVGKWSGGNYNKTNGYIDEVSVFNSELSAPDITAMYSTGVPADITSLTPVGWWRMGDGSDGSGNSDGTVVGGLPQVYNVATDGSGNRITGIDGSLTNIASPNGIVTDVPS